MTHCLRRPYGECDQCNPGPRNEASDLRTLFLFCEVTIKLYLFVICVIYSVVNVMEFFGPGSGRATGVEPGDPRAAPHGAAAHQLGRQCP